MGDGRNFLKGRCASLFNNDLFNEPTVIWAGSISLDSTFQGVPDHLSKMNLAVRQSTGMEKKASDWGEWMSTVITFTSIISIVILMVIVMVKILSAFAWWKDKPQSSVRPARGSFSQKVGSANPQVFHQALWNQLWVSQLCTPAYRGLRVHDSRLRPNQILVSYTHRVHIWL